MQLRVGIVLALGLACSDTARAPAGAPEGPLSCAAPPTTRQPPFRATFRLRNPGATPVFVQAWCGSLAVDVRSCTSRYTDRVGPQVVCGCDCDSPSCTMSLSCGQCAPLQAIAIGPGGFQDLPWDAVTTEYQWRTAYSCVKKTGLPSGRYSLVVPVFSTEALAMATTEPIRPAFRAGRTFALPAPDDLIELALVPDIEDPALASCGARPTQTPPVCAAPWINTKSCGLDQTYRYAFTGGLAPLSDQSVITAAGEHTRTRTFHFPPEDPPVACTTQVPTCGADHDTFTTADVLAALSDPDVAKAFDDPQPQVYGYDSRANDGSVLSITRADGRGMFLGSPCQSANGCGRPLTAGMQRAVQVFAHLDQQQRAAPGCEALAQP